MVLGEKIFTLATMSSDRDSPAITFLTLKVEATSTLRATTGLSGTPPTKSCLIMSSFPSKLRVFDVLSYEFVLEAHIQQLSQEDLPDLSESRYEISWFTGWSDMNEESLWEGDVVKRVKDTSAETQRREYEEHGTPADVEDPEQLIHDYSGGIAIIEWKDGGFVFDRLFGHEWAFHGPEGTLDVDLGREVKRLGSIHDEHINKVISKHADEKS